jgi:hypothetical protein
MRAHRGERVDRTFEAIEDVCLTVVNHLKRLVVIVPTGFATAMTPPRNCCSA